MDGSGATLRRIEQQRQARSPAPQSLMWHSSDRLFDVQTKSFHPVFEIPNFAPGVRQAWRPTRPGAASGMRVRRSALETDRRMVLFDLELALYFLVLLAVISPASALLSTSLKRAVTIGGGLNLSPALEEWRGADASTSWVGRDWNQPAGFSDQDELCGAESAAYNGLADVSATHTPPSANAHGPRLLDTH